jgi:hypothetical protein
MMEALNHNARAARRGIEPVRPSDEVLIRLAALLHDCGHGFLSHVSERAMMRIPQLPGGFNAGQLIREASAFFACRKKPALAEVLGALIVRLPEFVELLTVADVPFWPNPDNS